MDEQTFIREAGRGDAERARRALEAEPALARARDAGGVSVITATACAGRLSFAREIARRRSELDLFEASCVGEVDRVRSMLESDPGSIDHHAPEGFTPLVVAARLGHVGLVRTLIDRGADVDASSADARESRPIHGAAAHDDPARAMAMTRALLEAGADPNAQERGGATPLHSAVSRRRHELARLLIEFGASPHVSNDEGDSPLQLACAARDRPFIDLFEAPLPH